MSERRAAIERSLQGTDDWFDSRISEDLRQALINLVDRGMIIRVRGIDGKEGWTLTAKGERLKHIPLKHMER